MLQAAADNPVGNWNGATAGLIAIVSHLTFRSLTHCLI